MPTPPPTLPRLHRTLILAASAAITTAVVAANFGLARSYDTASQRTPMEARRMDRQLATTPRSCVPPAAARRCAAHGLARLVPARVSA